MGIQRVNTVGKQVLIEMDGKVASVTATEMQTRTGEQTKSLLESRLGRSFPFPVFFHKNRDGSMAIAIHNPPDVWPEDER